MDNNSTAPAEAPQAPESVATPINTNPEPAQAPQMPDMHGFTSEQLAEIDKFFKNNGGFDAIKSKISNPTPAPQPQAPSQPAQPAPQAQTTEEQPTQPTTPQVPEGYWSPSDINAMYYRQTLINDPKYVSIKEYIEKGDFIKDMQTMGMPTVDKYGNINNANIHRFLDLKAQTVPAQTANMSTASATPTVTYTEVGEKITSRDDAMKVIAEAGHPRRAEALEYLAQSIGLKKATEEKK